MVVLTARQRGHLAGTFLNTSNAIMVAWVLMNVLGHGLRWAILLAGVALYAALIAVALWVDP